MHDLGSGRRLDLRARGPEVRHGSDALLAHLPRPGRGPLHEGVLREDGAGDRRDGGGPARHLHGDDADPAGEDPPGGGEGEQGVRREDARGALQFSRRGTPYNAPGVSSRCQSTAGTTGSKSSEIGHGGSHRDPIRYTELKLGGSRKNHGLDQFLANDRKVLRSGRPPQKGVQLERSPLSGVLRVPSERCNRGESIVNPLLFFPRSATPCCGRGVQLERSPRSMVLRRRSEKCIRCTVKGRLLQPTQILKAILANPTIRRFLIHYFTL